MFIKALVWVGIFAFACFTIVLFGSWASWFWIIFLFSVLADMDSKTIE